MQHNIDALKILMLQIFTDEREKLQVFLVKLKLYIEFNQTKFKFKMNKNLFITFFLKNAAFNWVNLKLHDFLDKTSHERNTDKKFIYDNYEKFKKELWWIFKIVNETQATKQYIHVLQQNESVIKYSVKF